VYDILNVLRAADYLEDNSKSLEITKSRERKLPLITEDFTRREKEETNYISQFKADVLSLKTKIVLNFCFIRFQFFSKKNAHHNKEIRELEARNLNIKLNAAKSLINLNKRYGTQRPDILTLASTVRATTEPMSNFVLSNMI